MHAIDRPNYDGTYKMLPALGQSMYWSTVNSKRVATQPIEHHFRFQAFREFYSFFAL